MKQIILAIVVVVCIVAGGFGGHMLKSSMGGGAAAEADANGEGYDDGHGDEYADSHGDGDGHGGKSDDHGGKTDSYGGGGGGGDYGGGGYGGSSVYYYKFSREFVVPLMNNGRVESLVILNINIEADSSVSQELFSLDPKLRDNIMTTLISLSSDGDTFGEITDVNNYEAMRSLILLNLKNVVPNGLRNVLILDMAQQDL